jgi:hypothetical protein
MFQQLFQLTGLLKAFFFLDSSYHNTASMPFLNLTMKRSQVTTFNNEESFSEEVTGVEYLSHPRLAPSPTVWNNLLKHALPQSYNEA